MQTQLAGGALMCALMGALLGAPVPARAAQDANAPAGRVRDAAFDLRWEPTFGGLPWQHLVVFRKLS